MARLDADEAAVAWGFYNNLGAIERGEDPTDDDLEPYIKRFNAWLADHDREVAARAWDEGRIAHRDQGPWPTNPYRTGEF